MSSQDLQKTGQKAGERERKKQEARGRGKARFTGSAVSSLFGEELWLPGQQLQAWAGLENGCGRLGHLWEEALA